MSHSLIGGNLAAIFFYLKSLLCAIPYDPSSEELVLFYPKISVQLVSRSKSENRSERILTRYPIRQLLDMIVVKILELLFTRIEYGSFSLV